MGHKTSGLDEARPKVFGGIHTAWTDRAGERDEAAGLSVNVSYPVQALVGRLTTLGATYADDSQPHSIIKSAVEELHHLSARLRYVREQETNLCIEINARDGEITRLRHALELARFALGRA